MDLPTFCLFVTPNIKQASLLNFCSTVKYNTSYQGTYLEKFGLHVLHNINLKETVV